MRYIVKNKLFSLKSFCSNINTLILRQRYSHLGPLTITQVIEKVGGHISTGLGKQKIRLTSLFSIKNRPLVSRMDLERHIVERIFGMSHWTTHSIHSALDSVKYVLANFVKI